MGKIKRHHPVKLICGLIFKEEHIFDKTALLLQKIFGKIDFKSLLLDFGHTDYYEAEFGKGLKRAFISFRTLIMPEELSRIKLSTNNLEKKFSTSGRRMINIDPGYMDSAKLILASTKDYKHRICLAGGIYAEITLFYQNKTFNPWEWTYPDYKSTEYIAIFNQIRSIYLKQIHNKCIQVTLQPAITED